MDIELTGQAIKPHRMIAGWVGWEKGRGYLIFLCFLVLKKGKTFTTRLFYAAEEKPIDAKEDKKKKKKKKEKNKKKIK